MSYIPKDEQLLIKIKKYMNKLQHLYDSIVHLSDNEIDEGIEGLALAQCITNLFEISSRINNDIIAQKLMILNSGRISGFRNISAHDYDAVNWSIAKNNCKTILTTVTDIVMQECFDEIEKEKSKVKDYT